MNITFFDTEPEQEQVVEQITNNGISFENENTSEIFQNEIAKNMIFVI